MKFKMNIPNTLTMIRILCTPLMILMFLLPIPKGIGVFIALGIYVIACITDSLDGYIARKYNLVTDFGKFMDQIADKFITTTAMILVLFGSKPVTCSWLSVLMLLIVVLRDILISGIRMVAANKDVVIAADIFGKVKSLFLDLASMVLILFIGLREVVTSDFLRYVQVFGLSLMIIGVVLTIVSCVNYTVKAIKQLCPAPEKTEDDDEEAAPEYDDE